MFIDKHGMYQVSYRKYFQNYVFSELWNMLNSFCAKYNQAYVLVNYSEIMYD
jgi:type IV secretory pathway VirB6-like protein